MLIKEYRIPLPLTVEEYRIAQLYMIAVSIFQWKKSSRKILNFSEKKPGRKQRAGQWSGDTHQ